MVLQRLEDDPDSTLVYLNVASMFLMAVSNSIRNNHGVDENIKTFLIGFGQWFESFKNSATIREGGKELFCFDEDTFNRMPRIKTNSGDY